jgi:hypothetical protein
MNNDVYKNPGKWFAVSPGDMGEADLFLDDPECADLHRRMQEGELRIEQSWQNGRLYVRFLHRDGRETLAASSTDGNVITTEILLGETDES